MSTRTGALLALITTLALAACQPAAPSTPEAPPTFTYQGSDVAQFDTYQARFVLEFDGSNLSGAPAAVRWENNVQGQKEPATFALRSEFSGEGLEAVDAFQGAGGSVYLLNTPETSYLETVSGIERYCVAIPATGEDPALAYEDLVPDLNDFLGQDSASPVLGLVAAQEEVNGVQAAHYRAENITTDANLQNATIDLWYVLDPGYVVRISMTGAGDIPELGTGAITITYDVLSVNQGLEFAIPENCAEFDAPQG